MITTSHGSTQRAAWSSACSWRVGLLLAFEMKGLLIGESPSAEDLDVISETLATSPHVRRVIEVRSQHLGPEELLVAAKVELDSDLDFRGVTEAIDGAQTRVRERLPSAVHLYLEPDRPSDDSVHVAK